MKRLTNLILVTVLSAPILAGCGSSLKMNSGWRDREIAIDGQQQEWQDAMTFVEKKNVAVGFINDEEYLYVRMTTTNRDIERQLMARGFTIWFDADGGKDKKFGIKFPIGMFEMGMMMRGRDRGEDVESMRENFEKSLTDLEIIMPGEKEPMRMRTTEAKGIEVKIGVPQENLVYELKVPLHKDDAHPYAIEAKAGKPIGVGFETAEIDFNKMREQMGRPMGGRRPGGFDGRGGFGGRGGMMGGRPQMPEPFKLWVSVQLSSGN